MKQPHARVPEIALVNGSIWEQQTKDQLLQLCEQYPLDRWLYTEKIQIETRTIPHSHPILTLNTRCLDDSQELVATYIHEQIHWFLSLEEHVEQSEEAIEVFRQMYPLLPVGFPDGCNNELSNFLHVLVNYLEYLGLIDLFGHETARQILERKPNYKKIYELILREAEKIGTVVVRYGLLLPEKPPEEKRFME